MNEIKSENFYNNFFIFINFVLSLLHAVKMQNTRHFMGGKNLAKFFKEMMKWNFIQKFPLNFCFFSHSSVDDFLMQKDGWSGWFFYVRIKNKEEKTVSSKAVTSGMSTCGQVYQHFASIFRSQILSTKNTNPNCKHIIGVQKYLCINKVLLKGWWNWHLKACIACSMSLTLLN